MTQYWFTPHAHYTGPPIELGCGYHDKRGKFHPQNGKYRCRMVGDPPTLYPGDIPTLQAIYDMHQVDRRPVALPDRQGTTWPRSGGREMRKWERDLRKIPGVVSLELTGGGHIKLKLQNGRSVFCSSTPSDVYAIKNAGRQVGRELRWRGLALERA